MFLLICLFLETGADIGLGWKGKMDEVKMTTRAP